MPWLLMSPGHQQPWYWLCRRGRFLFYLRNDFNYLCRINVAKWRKMFIFPLKNLARKGLIVLNKLLFVWIPAVVYNPVVFIIIGYCQPHWMGRGQHPNLKMDMMILHNQITHIWCWNRQHFHKSHIVLTWCMTKNSAPCIWDYDNPITMKFCTCHNSSSSAVMVCEKFQCDSLLRISQFWMSLVK